MASLVDEQQQWFDETTNTPIVDGFIYVGERNADPRVEKAIFSDRELTTALDNPQRTDAAGRSVNKIWTDGRFSIEVTNSDDVQRYIELDNGEGAGAGVIALGDVQGANTITATASTTITEYVDLQQYVFRTVQINTGAVTLNIDGIGAKSVLKNHDEALVAGDLEADQNVIVTFNETDDVFELANQNLKTLVASIDPNLAIITATFPTSGPQTAEAFESVTADTTSGAFTVNLPASPTQNDFVQFVVGADYTVNNLTIGRNSETIMGDSADMVVSTNNPISFRFDGSDWRIA